MNGNVKVYLGIAIIFLWIHTLFTAHELMSEMPEGGKMQDITNAISRMTRSSSFKSFTNKAGGLTIGTDDTESSSEKDEFHVVFSTDCSTYQHWQSIVCFFSAKRVGQGGTITRIASGCTEEEQRHVEALHRRLPAQFKVHFTPDFKEDKKTGKRYDFFNKPFGMLHWLEHAQGVGQDAVIALIDPDFFFLRPLTAVVGAEAEVIVTDPVVYRELPLRVEKGHPIGQQYGLGAHWLRFNRSYVCGAGSPCTRTTEAEAVRYFPVGPPYIAHRKDLHDIATTWADFVPRIYEEYPHLLAEMYGYCMAAAHLGLRHGRVDHLMISNPTATGEGWEYIDNMPPLQTCTAWGEGSGPHHSLARPLPTFIHMCQSYRVDDWFFHKRQVPMVKGDVTWPQPSGSVLSCGHPLPGPSPPVDLETRLWQRKPHNTTIELKPKLAKRNAYVLCMAYNGIAYALADFKSIMCTDSNLVALRGSEAVGGGDKFFRIQPPTPLYD